MKITIALSFLAVLYTVEAYPAESADLEILRIRTRELKWNIETAIRQLELLRTQTEEDTLQKITVKWSEEQDSHREYKTLLLSGIRTEVNAAKAAGKDATSCLAEATQGVENNEQIAYKEANACIGSAEDSIHNNLGFIDNLISTGDSLSLQSDSIFLNCHDSDDYRMRSCIISELTKAESSLKTLESDSITAELTITPVSKNVVTQATNCVKNAYSLTYTEGAAIRMRITQCIETITTPTTTIATTTQKPTTKK
ncbi:hypothetical protein ALC56_09774 [Trachymyrmex septentrionalis]|uniref:Protein TsetseEP domain-containing protein n=1 Tax=Trachymyrmex septentrionalis TaxID=34720 RepID=A0A195F686_9HYME|nr:PREDICTED: uncharacterized protein LOC108751322 [Trachymyrmex septentrionalis]KYN35983.1 hypothetical protein ALC56_09774 [Trachymyrmex septentrionalis]